METSLSLAGIQEYTTICIDKSNMSEYLKTGLRKRLRIVPGTNKQEAMMDVEVFLLVDECHRLCFEAKHGGCSLGKGELRFDATRPG